MRHVVHVLSVPDSLVFLRGQLRYLTKRGYRFTVVTSDGPHIAKFREQEGVEVVVVPLPRRISPVTDLRSVRELAAVLRQLRPDIVHAHTPKGGLIGMLAAAVARVPARIYHMRGLPLETARGAMRVALRTTETTSCAVASRVVSVSPSLRQRAIDLRLVRPGKIGVLAFGSGNGVDAKRFDPANVSDAEIAALRERFGATPNTPLVGFVGRLAVDKGVNELMQAWERVKHLHPTAKLVLAGGMDARDGISSEVHRRLQSDPSIVLSGHVDPILAFYRSIDLLVLPTYREGLPNVLLEASAMELPIVATRATGCVDVVEEGRTGALVPVGDGPSLATAIDHYLRDPELGRAHGRAGRARILERFRPEGIWDALDELYRDVAAS